MKINRTVLKENGFTSVEIDTVLNRIKVMGISKEEMMKNHKGHLYIMQYFYFKDYEEKYTEWVKTLNMKYIQSNKETFAKLKKIKG